MQYTSKYESPLGSIVLAADEIGLTGLWFEGQKYFVVLLRGGYMISSQFFAYRILDIGLHLMIGTDGI